jgi:hypothetical protein
MSKKRFDENAIMNELSDSAFFRQPKSASAEPSPSTGDRREEPTQPRTPDSSTSRTPRMVVHPVRPVRVIKSRHPFDIYQDQVESLQRLSAEERMQGGLGSMSKMVRDAIDAYLESRGYQRE